jgi:phenylpyruvate tautomerase PptA (4-oxalocrotonate tautomerase family)
MPFVRIDALEASPDRLDALGRAVLDALVETIGVPRDDRFMVLASHDRESSTLHHDNYLGVHRDEGIVYIAITMRSGRTHTQKQALYRRIAELAHEYSDTEPRNVFVILTENESIDWSLGHGIAQYVASSNAPGPLATTVTD